MVLPSVGGRELNFYIQIKTFTPKYQLIFQIICYFLFSLVCFVHFDVKYERFSESRSGRSLQQTAERNILIFVAVSCVEPVCFSSLDIGMLEERCCVRV